MYVHPKSPSRPLEADSQSHPKQTNSYQGLMIPSLWGIDPSLKVEGRDGDGAVYLSCLLRIFGCRARRTLRVLSSTTGARDAETARLSYGGYTAGFTIIS